MNEKKKKKNITTWRLTGSGCTAGPKHLVPSWVTGTSMVTTVVWCVHVRTHFCSFQRHLLCAAFAGSLTIPCLKMNHHWIKFHCVYVIFIFLLTMVLVSLMVSITGTVVSVSQSVIAISWCSQFVTLAMSVSVNQFNVQSLEFVFLTNTCSGIYFVKQAIVYFTPTLPLSHPLLMPFTLIGLYRRLYSVCMFYHCEIKCAMF